MQPENSSKPKEFVACQVMKATDLVGYQTGAFEFE